VRDFYEIDRGNGEIRTGNDSYHTHVPSDGGEACELES
jgi:hypothetical protein